MISLVQCNKLRQCPPLRPPNYTTASPTLGLGAGISHPRKVGGACAPVPHVEARCEDSRPHHGAEARKAHLVPLAPGCCCYCNGYMESAL